MRTMVIRRWQREDRENNFGLDYKKNDDKERFNGYLTVKSLLL